MLYAIKTMLLFFSFTVPLFFPFKCSRDLVIDCSNYQYDFSDLACNYKADFIETTNRCNSDSISPPYIKNDTLDYFLQLKENGTGKISGPDTLTEFEWIVENITSTTGKSSGGCHNEFWIWTKQGKIEYDLFTVNEWGLEIYLSDSSWNYKDCHR